MRDNPRAMKRLIKEVSNIKDVLSANKEKHVKIPELADYIDLVMTVTREDFEAAIQPHIQAIVKSVQELVLRTGYTSSYVHSYEIIGGGLRVPAVKDALMTALSVDTLGQHINGDEAMSFGASYIAANLSASFVVRDLYLIE